MCELAELPNKEDNKDVNSQTTTTTTNGTSAVRGKWTGKIPTMILVALTAIIAILVFVVLVITITFSLQARESNTEIETLKQQFMEISRQSSLFNNSNQQLSLQVASSVQMLERKVQSFEKMIESAVEDLSEQLAADVQLLHLEVQKNNTANRLEYIKRLEELQVQVHANDTAINLEIEQRLRELEIDKLRSSISTTKIQLSENIANVTTLLTEELNLQLDRTESRTLSTLNNELANVTMLIQTISLQVNDVETQVNLTQRSVEQIKLELPELLENVTTPLVTDIDQLRDEMNNSLKAFELQFTNALHNLSVKSAANIQALQLEVHRNNTANQLDNRKRLEKLQLEVLANDTKIYLEIEQALGELEIDELKSSINATTSKLSAKIANVTASLTNMLNQQLDTRERLEELKLDIQANYTAVRLQFEQKLKELEIDELRSSINTTTIQINEDIVNVTASLTEMLNQQLDRIESQTLGTLNNELANVTMMVESTSVRVNNVESQVNLTQRSVEKINLELPELLENVTALLDMSIVGLKDEINISLETIGVNFTNAFHQLSEQLAADVQTLQWEVQRNTTAIQLESRKRLEKLQLEVQANDTAILLQFEQKLKELEIYELKSTINMTVMMLNEDIANVTASLTQILNQHLNKAESQTHSILNNQLNNVTLLIETVSLRLNKVESQVNITQGNVEQVNLELPEVLLNVTTPLILTIHQINVEINKSLGTLESQFTTAIHDLSQQLNKSNNDVESIIGSKYC